MARLTLTDLTSLTNEASAIAAINANFASIETEFEKPVYRDGEVTNTMSSDIDLNGNDLLNVNSIGTVGGGTILAQVGYAEEWASKAEDSLVTVAAGGNGTTEYSALHWAAKAAADTVLTAADAVSTAADAVSTAADAASAAVSAGIVGIKGGDLTSAEPLVIGSDGNYFDVTGVVGVATHTVATNRHYFTQFDGALLLTHHATTQDLPGEANITTAAGDVAEWQSTGANTVQCVNYTKANGTAVAGGDVVGPASATDNSLAKFDGTTGKLLKDGAVIGADVQAYDVDTLKADVADVLTAGYAATPYSAGTKSTGTYTPDEALGNFQYVVNGGAHTLAPPTNNCTLVIQYTNNGSAGALTTSGFTIVTGDALTTVNADDFFAYITKNNAFSHLHITALQ